MSSVNRNYKDTVFRDLFGAPENRANALSLYNALAGTSYDDPEGLELTTLDDALYLGLKDDVSFLIDSEQVLWEHQSTANPNMPLRGLRYFADLYSKHVDLQDLNLYGTSLVRLPRPRYVVFYFGEDERPDCEVLHLSDAWKGGGDLEVTTTVINCNLGHNAELAEQCEALAGYAYFVDTVREYRRVGMPIEKAVDAAVSRCIDEGVLADYFSTKRSEVTRMFLYEYDEEKVRRHLLREGREQGLELGREQGLEQGVLSSLRGLMANLSLSLPQALDALGIPEDDRPRYEQLLAES